MRKSIYLIFTAFIILIAVFFSYPLFLTGLAKFLVVENKLQKVDAIVVLAGDGNGERVAEGVNLYKKGYASYIIMTGGRLAWHLTYAQNMFGQARYLGIPAKAILLEDKSLSTIENAKFTLPIVKKKKFNSIILVSSPFHMRRVLRVFRKIYKGSGVEIFGYPVQNSEFNIDKWWTRHEDTQVVVQEWVNLAGYFLKGY
jgi:uncharacterized SAM-binding protein YcdF (DUF218 family)